MTRLDDLGPRICILGSSNSGKSTLADAISRSRGLPPVHLDQLHHLRHTDWQPRPAEEFAALHQAAIASPRWVMDGNYRTLLPPRLERATGLILLNASTALSLFRYFRRSWFERDRRGGLEGGSERVKWEMIHYVLASAGQKRVRYDEIFERTPLPKIRLADAEAVKAFYRAEGLMP